MAGGLILVARDPLGVLILQGNISAGTVLLLLLRSRCYVPALSSSHGGFPLAAHPAMSRPGSGGLAPGCSQWSRMPARRTPLRPGMPVRYARADLSLAPARR